MLRVDTNVLIDVLQDDPSWAHTAVAGWPLLTRDASRFRTYFPTLEVLQP